MPDAQASFPFFVSLDPRPLSAQERAIVERLLREQPLRYSEQAGALKVVGRCGCGACPTVFFQPDNDGDCESDLVTMAGKDGADGLVAAVLLEKEGVLSQLEFYSVDGHDPWGIPNVETLEPW
ncbi:hypothetical protein [Rubrivivax gelatinosus]|uniref:hypothetical protein n=1 Tax=Rubrivivax gelatinosus TaxID=28068 RepID=UPI001903E901|nr:hypothetical protein [Rubrivivax gelatinosus]